MSDQFKPGDVVRLKSGSLPMTVDQVAEDNLGRFKVWVQWFDEKNELQHAAFIPAMVEADKAATYA